MQKLDVARLSEISKGLKLLYVEDDDFIMQSMKIILGDIFGEISTASNGIEALLLMEKTNFDILLTDAMMPRMDGLELIRELRNRGCDIEIGVVSGLDEEALDKLKKLGVQESIPKPIHPSTLFGALFRLCEAASQKINR